jgi:enoyl-CoA hydratase
VGDVLEVTRNEGWWLLTLNRPGQLNAVDVEVCQRLREVVNEAEASASARCLVITGSGRAFSAGADIGALEAMGSGMEFAAFIEQMATTYGLLEQSPLPSVAAINGAALGGGLELALACDFRIAAPGIRLGVPEVKLGLLPGAGGTQRLPRLVGLAAARRMLMTGAPVDSSRALAVGLVDEVTEDALSAAKALASQLAAAPPRALAAAKRLLRTFDTGQLDGGIAAERAEVAMLFDEPDRIEGIAAFRARRPPAFSGHPAR